MFSVFKKIVSTAAGDMEYIVLAGGLKAFWKKSYIFQYQLKKKRGYLDTCINSLSLYHYSVTEKQMILLEVLHCP